MISLEKSTKEVDSCEEEHMSYGNTGAAHNLDVTMQLDIEEGALRDF